MIRPYMTPVSNVDEGWDYNDEPPSHQDFERSSDAEDQVDHGVEVVILKHFYQDKYSWER